MTRITSGDPAQEFAYCQDEPSEHWTEGAMPVLIQTAAEVLRVSAIPLVIASIILIAFELVLIG